MVTKTKSFRKTDVAESLEPGQEWNGGAKAELE